MPTDKFGVIWDLLPAELCSVCGQPDNCGDCNHEPMEEQQILECGGRRMTVGTEVFYMWKETMIVSRDNRDELLLKPYERLITPHGDPMVYEFPIDIQFDNMRAAIDWRDEEIEIANDVDDADYIAEMRAWVLTKVTYEPVDDVAASWQATATRILEARRTGNYQPLIDSLPEYLRPTDQEWDHLPPEVRNHLDPGSDDLQP